MPTEMLLQQFARAPKPGQVKTRMRPFLTTEEACGLHRRLVLWTCGQLVQSRLGEVELHVTGTTADSLFEQCLQLGANRVVEQNGERLGDRMYNAIQRGLKDHQKVILVGSDCPAISPAYLAQAAAVLDREPLVIGPAEDGGYVLIGATHVEASLFEDVEWGSGRVLEQTLLRCQAASIAYELLPALRDIDRAEDLPEWKAARNQAMHK